MREIWRRKLTEEDWVAIEACLDRISSPNDREMLKSMISEMVAHNTLPVQLLSDIPNVPSNVKMTKFDQLYAAAMSLVFPDYRTATLEKLIGDITPETEGIKIWRVMFPPKFKVSHILLRAHTYQEAFALACDYACRLSLYLFQSVPYDLTIRVHFMHEKRLRGYLGVRTATRGRKRRIFKLEGREFTERQLNGARIATSGPPKNQNQSIYRYMEKKDLRYLREKHKLFRVSAVQSESFGESDIGKFGSFPSKPKLPKQVYRPMSETMKDIIEGVQKPKPKKKRKKKEKASPL